MAKITLSKGYEAEIDDDDLWVLDGPSWHAMTSKRHSHVYARRNKPGGGTELLHRVITGVTDPKIHVDHRDGNGLNCRKINLRPGSRLSNIRNQDPDRRPGYKWSEKEQRWIVQISANGKNHHIGRFKNKVDAQAARTAAELKHWGYVPVRRRRGAEEA